MQNSKWINKGSGFNTVYKAVTTGVTGEPPNLTSLLNKYGNARIQYIKINRTPVQKGMTSALNFFSKNKNNFLNEFAKLPYDSLYHLQMIISTDKGRVVLEKNERINMSERPIETETINVTFPVGLTIRQIYDNGKRVMGSKFFTYSASSNNCQDFIMGLLTGSNLNSPQVTAFTKQNTATLFKNDSRLRKISNTVTDIGARANAVFQGGEL